MIFTKQILIDGRSSNGGYNSKQLAILGIDTQNLRKGWMRSLIGKDLSEEKIKQFLNLKDVHLGDEQKPKIKKNGNDIFI